MNKQTDERQASAGQVQRPVRPLSLAEQAAPVQGWIRVVDDYPNHNDVVAILHFGGSEHQIEDTATVDQWGICPHAKDGGHGKRSTVTHWRRIAA